jgi:membrane-associated phospholipid phosphatase
MIKTNSDRYNFYGALAAKDKDGRVKAEGSLFSAICLYYRFTKKYYTLLNFQTAAHWLSDIFNPITGIAITAAILTAVYTPATFDEWAWFLFALLALTSAPVLCLFVLVKRGEIMDIHIPERKARLKPLAFTLLWLALWTALFPLLGMTEVFVFLLKGVLLLFAGLRLVTLVWKISFHTAMISMSAAVVAVAANVSIVWVVTTILLVLLVVWARVYLQRHTFAQALVGVLAGAVAGYFLVLNMVVQAV